MRHQITGARAASNARHNLIRPADRAYRYWRLYIYQTVSNPDALIYEFRLWTDVDGGGTNVALGMTATADSTSGSFVPANAVDGNLTTRWLSTSTTIRNHWLQVDLVTAYNIKSFSIMLATSSFYGVRDFSIQASNNAVDWTTLGEWTGETSWTDNVFRTFNVPDQWTERLSKIRNSRVFAEIAHRPIVPVNVTRVFAEVARSIATTAPSTSTFNPTGKSADVTLSDDNRTAEKVTTPATTSITRSTTSKTTGKWVIEFQLIGATPVVGFVNATPTSSGQSVGSNGVWYETSNASRGIVQNITVLMATVSDANLPQYGVPTMLAIDLDNRKMSVRLANQTWNNDPADLVTTRQATYAAITGALYWMLNATAVGGKINVNSGSQPFTNPIPSGYSAWG